MYDRTNRRTNGTWRMCQAEAEARTVGVSLFPVSFILGLGNWQLCCAVISAVLLNGVPQRQRTSTRAQYIFLIC